MARFDKVHWNAKVPDDLKPGEMFYIALKEPIFSVPASNPVRYVLVVTIDHTGKLVPWDAANQRLLDDWKERHKNTPEYMF